MPGTIRCRGRRAGGIRGQACGSDGHLARKPVDERSAARCGLTNLCETLWQPLDLRYRTVQGRFATTYAPGDEEGLPVEMSVLLEMTPRIGGL